MLVTHGAGKMNGACVRYLAQLAIGLISQRYELLAIFLQPIWYHSEVSFFKVYAPNNRQQYFDAMLKIKVPLG